MNSVFPGENQSSKKKGSLWSRKVNLMGLWTDSKNQSRRAAVISQGEVGSLLSNSLTGNLVCSVIDQRSSPECKKNRSRSAPGFKHEKTQAKVEIESKNKVVRVNKPQY